jgi:hypothetical protein
MKYEFILYLYLEYNTFLGNVIFVFAIICTPLGTLNIPLTSFLFIIQTVITQRKFFKSSFKALTKNKLKDNLI